MSFRSPMKTGPRRDNGRPLDATEVPVNATRTIRPAERGIYMPEGETLLAIAEALGHELAFFYTDHSSPPVKEAA